MSIAFSKEGAVRFSSVVVAENEAPISLYTSRYHQKHAFDFFILGNAAEFVVKSDRYFCFEEVFLLFIGWHILNVSKLIDVVKLCNVDFDMQF
jgi:hypothetical protein